MIKSFLKTITLLVLIVNLFTACDREKKTSEEKKIKEENKIKVILDSDANNELDDQHALAYLLLNGKKFDVLGVTVNATSSGGNIDKQYDEAKRVMQMVNQFNKIPLFKGANGSFEQIKNTLSGQSFDGADAVNFIIQKAREAGDEKLVLIPVGKLTNIALALEKDPAIADRIRIVWLGSNYPEPGEYNQDNDTVAMNYILNKKVPFEMVTVRYGKPSGSGVVTATQSEIEQKMPGVGPQAKEAVTGRHGGTFSNFGDYSVNLFKHIEYYDESKSRSLFDMVAVAIIKEPSWGQASDKPAPVLINNQWVERPDNPRSIVIWENFDKAKIMADFYNVMQNYDLADTGN